MKFISTRKASPPVHFSDALTKGLAPDGGLYVPEHFPRLDANEFNADWTHAEFGIKLLSPFFEGDRLEKFLSEICKAALNFPIPLRRLDETHFVLELFHGPTAAFKDVGARFLAECASRETNDGKKRTVIVATSGDTGGAVAGAFYEKPGIEVIVLYPLGKISARQEKQIAAWGKNVRAFAVRGSFDDCQRIVKEALANQELRKERSFISANSISVGRLLPQMIYYAKASAQYKKQTGKTPGFIVPTGNLGNAVAALWAKKIGFPIRKVILATNANNSIADYFATGAWKPKATISTLANAMDVGNPSNMERLLALYPALDELTKDVATVSVSDQEISETIKSVHSRFSEPICPHTATAFLALERLGEKEMIVVATAHPAKFETIVEPLIGKNVAVPKALAELLNRKSEFTAIDPSLAEFTKAL